MWQYLMSWYKKLDNNQWKYTVAWRVPVYVDWWYNQSFVHWPQNWIFDDLKIQGARFKTCTGSIVLSFIESPQILVDNLYRLHHLATPSRFMEGKKLVELGNDTTFLADAKCKYCNILDQDNNTILECFVNLSDMFDHVWIHEGILACMYSNSKINNSWLYNQAARIKYIRNMLDEDLDHIIYYIHLRDDPYEQWCIKLLQNWMKQWDGSKKYWDILGRNFHMKYFSSIPIILSSDK